MRRALVVVVVAILGLCAGAAPGFGQGYPARPVVVVVPYAPGGNTDVVARIVFEHVSRILGQQFVIENVAGAGGTTGSARAARSAPDGYTLLVGQMGTHGAAPALYPQLAYDPVADFEHVGQLTDTPVAVFARRDFPASTLQEFIAVLKARGGSLNNGHGGVGSTSHITCVLLTNLVGAKAPMVAYRGSGPALNDLIAGQIDFMCDQIPHAAPQVHAGTIKAFAIATPERSPALPQVPTTAEGGLPDFLASGWNAVFAPKGTPAAILEKLVEAIGRSLDDPATRKRLEEIGAVIPKERGPQALRALVAYEVARWPPVLGTAGVRAP